jgi:thymidine phosphorylase
MQVLNNDPDAPADLRQKSLRLAGRILEFDPDVRGGYGYAIARDILDSGRALQKMQDIIQAQGARNVVMEPGKLHYEVCADKSGVVTQIDNYLLGKVARLAGAPMDKGAGIDVLKKLGDEVKKGEALYRVHAEYQSDYNFARNLTDENTGYHIGKPEEVSKTYMEF